MDQIARWVSEQRDRMDLAERTIPLVLGLTGSICVGAGAAAAPAQAPRGEGEIDMTTMTTARPSTRTRCPRPCAAPRSSTSSRRQHALMPPARRCGGESRRSGGRSAGETTSGPSPTSPSPCATGAWPRRSCRHPRHEPTRVAHRRHRHDVRRVGVRPRLPLERGEPGVLRAGAQRRTSLLRRECRPVDQGAAPAIGAAGAGTRRCHGRCDGLDDGFITSLDDLRRRARRAANRRPEASMRSSRRSSRPISQPSCTPAARPDRPRAR